MQSEYEQGLRAAGIEPYSRNPSETKPLAVCPSPTEARVTCLSAVVPEDLAEEERSSAGSAVLEGSGELGGYSPADLRSAYNLPAKGGAGLTIAITIAFDYPSAESDLAVYRETYGLPPCTSQNGCFRKVNQDGAAANYPEARASWAAETALDLDMASAICPECRLLVVEADDNTYENLPLAVDTAAELGADVISNSWGGGEFSGQTSFNTHFDHPGVPVLFASGDSGYEVSYPAASPDVIAVGGTSLHKDKGARGWRETAWGGAGSGCSKYQEKPEWQTDEGCTKRTVSDVSAVADPNTPVSVYDSYAQAGWMLFGGTSVSSPLLAGVEALSSAADRSTAARLFWEQGPEGELFDVTEGQNGACPKGSSYLCSSGMGYDGPTGWGTPGGSRPGPPVVAAENASDVTKDGATLTGAVNPNGKETTYRFEYGLTADYGASVPIPVGPVGSGTQPTSIEQSLTGLASSTTYHYRLVAVNDFGTTYSRDRTFGTTRWTTQSTYPHKWEDEAVSCTSATFCIAVGSRFIIGYSFGNEVPAATHWNGSNWVDDSVPMPHLPTSGYTSWLSGVSCTSPDACMAVGGNYEHDPGFQPLAEQWDGSNWSIVPMPMPGAATKSPLNGQRDARLNKISCVSASYCVAVGEFNKTWSSGSPTEISTLIEVWDGYRWTVQPSPNLPGRNDNRLRGISCVSSTFCVAVGASDIIYEDSLRPLIETWDGSSWSIAPSPNLSGGLEDVSCSSEDACVAVGSTEGQYVGGSGLAEVWDGTDWSSETPAHSLQGVSCLAADWCIGVGPGHVHPWEAEAVGERWNGSDWVPETPALPVDRSDEPMRLYDVSCISSGCTAVGWYWSWGYRFLAEHLDLSSPTATTDAVGSRTKTTAILNGHVNSNSGGAGAACSFQISLASDPSFSSPIETLACASPNEVVTGEASKAVTATATGLAVGTKYIYRVVAEPDYGPTARGAPRSFSTPPVVVSPPTVTTSEGTSGTTSTAALVSGTINPNGGNITACMVEYGLTTSYGSKVDCASLPGSGFDPVPVSASLSGLEVDTPYHFRLAATNSAGTVEGADQVFSTAKAGLPDIPLAIVKAGTGTGTVKSQPVAINCGVTCATIDASFLQGTVVVLTATPVTTAGSTFSGWSGACSGTGTCVVTMSEAKTVKAIFSGTAKAIANPQMLTLKKAGTGQGTVRSSPAGIICKATCTQTSAYYIGGTTQPKVNPAMVTLTATATAGSTFSGWSGACSGTGTCVVTMSEAKTVTPAFDK